MVEPAMFLFEVVVQSVESYVDSRQLVIRSDFADVFSLELKDPKQMHIVIPDPPPLPPEPPGKKKGKKAKPKPKKKGKKGAVELPPPEPVIQAGQSVLFTSSAEFLIQSMKKFPMQISLWSKEDIYSFIGSTPIPWDPIYLKFLERICNCEDPPAVTLNETYNIFEEGKAKIMAKLGLQIKLSYLKDKVTTSFRTLTEDLNAKKYLYTGINSKTTSYMCTMKTTDEDFIEHSNKIENNYVKDKPKGIAYADYKNAPGANLTFFNEGDYCCMGHADKPPESIYKSAETCPDVDFIVDYVRKIIVSCNDNMRMLTPRPTIRPRVKATDIDRLCYCKETKWPAGSLADQFKKEAQSEPCPVCINAAAGQKPEKSGGTTFDIANIRGPCGKPDCRIARDLRAYIQNLVEEDNQEINLNEIIGPCGSTTCTLAEKIQEFLRHEGTFAQGSTLEGLSTQCACIQQMQDALTKRHSCQSVCSKDCAESDSSKSQCEGKGCPFKQEDQPVYDVYYFTVEYDFDKVSPPGSVSPSPSAPDASKNYPYCSEECPTIKASEKTFCSTKSCNIPKNETEDDEGPSKCVEPVCPNIDQVFPPSPADSEIIIHFDAIHNQCCIKTCDAAEKVKDYIVDGIMSKKHKIATDDEDPCYCDCVCDLKFTKKTTYCAICGGFESLGDDMKTAPAYARPHPCPVYHKLYDRKVLKTTSPWPHENEPPKADNVSVKSSKTIKSRAASQSKESHHGDIQRDGRTSTLVTSTKSKKGKPEKKKVGKFTVNVQEKEDTPPAEKKIDPKYPYPAVPKNKGWNWTAEDIPGLKPRPKWKPGAANKILVRRYRALREGVDTIAKKKRALLQKRKKIEMKPTVVISKKGGEYTVQMEVFKTYSKERLPFQYPYDEKPPLIYTIGKTEAEKRKLQAQRDRRTRRETRRKSRLLQSTFRDKCQEICLKAYNQAIGLLPLPNPNDPDCPCHTVPPESPPIDSCSCSEEGTLSSSDTDDDEWVVEFTPPLARWDPKAKHPPVLVENESQYTYLDYKVKVLDKQGNQVPRFFKGPDGKQECSDLGGFWGTGHVWNEINRDGYIGPDNRWVPMNFIGPDGMFYSAEEGFFVDNNGQNLKIGIDGYVDKDGKWAYYSKKYAPRTGTSKSTIATTDTRKTAKPETKTDDKKGKPKPDAKGEHAKGKEGDKKSAKKSEQDKGKKAVTIADGKRKKSAIAMNVLLDSSRNKMSRSPVSDNMRIDPKKLAKYQEIMRSLEMYDSLCELKAPLKTNRASNTPKKRITPFTNRHTVTLVPNKTIASSRSTISRDFR